ncbi:MAG: hypothetical protein M3032_12140 [Verrucomicrobiota bacterium]|nr:hypothetical protein [Verrucomicrobiota bacterium]
MIDVALHFGERVSSTVPSTVKDTVIVGTWPIPAFFVDLAIVAILLRPGLFNAQLLSPALLIQTRLILLVFFVRKCRASERGEAQK